MKNGDESKLPRWAQVELQRLRANLEHAEAKLAAGPEDSDTFADPYSENARRPLGKGTLMQFGVERGGRFGVRYQNGCLEVNADEALAVRPVASNTIRLEIRRWDA